MINVFNPGLENTVEALMRLAVAGAAPLNTDVEDLGPIGRVFGLQRNARYVDILQDAVPGTLLPPRQLLQSPARRRYTLVCRVDHPHENAVPFDTIVPILTDFVFLFSTGWFRTH